MMGQLGLMGRMRPMGKISPLGPAHLPLAPVASFASSPINAPSPGSHPSSHFVTLLCHNGLIFSLALPLIGCFANT